MKIEVKQEHIDKGIQCSAESCPIARAVKAKTHRSVYVSDNDMHYTRSSGNTVMVDLPTVAQKFIAAFDKGQKVRPFAFEV